MSSNKFQNELRNLEAEREWTELRFYHRTRLVDFLKLSEDLVSNIDKMLSLYEKEFTINGVTSELAAMGEDIAEDAFALAKIINLLGEEGGHVCKSSRANRKRCGSSYRKCPIVDLTGHSFLQIAQGGESPRLPCG